MSDSADTLEVPDTVEDVEVAEIVDVVDAADVANRLSLTLSFLLTTGRTVHEDESGGEMGYNQPLITRIAHFNSKPCTLTYHDLQLWILAESDLEHRG